MTKSENKLATTAAAPAVRKLPTLDELYSDKISTARHNRLNMILNNPPKSEWLKKHPMARNVVYLPIERVEYLLTCIFVQWRVEIKELKMIANSIVTTVRLHVLDPVSGQWTYQDGVGASPVQTDKGASATDFAKVKNDAVMKAAPASKSYAIKDAAEQLGKLFGKDLNRADQIGYDVLKTKLEKTGFKKAENT